MLPLRPLLVCAALISAPTWAADELTPEQIAKIQSEQAKAQKAVEKKFGNRPSSELTNEERREMIAESQAAAREVFEQHGVTPKEFALRELRLSRDDRAAVEAARAAITAKEEAARAKAEAPPSPPEPEVQIVRGTSDENPMEVFRDDQAVNVERPNEDGIIERSEDDAAALDGQSTQPIETDTTSRP